MGHAEAIGHGGPDVRTRVIGCVDRPTRGEICVTSVNRAALQGVEILCVDAPGVADLGDSSERQCRSEEGEYFHVWCEQVFLSR